MTGLDISRTDSLIFHVEAAGSPLTEGGIGLEPLLDALEMHAGELMPTTAHGKRTRKYNRANVAKAIAEKARDSMFGPTIYLERPPTPDVNLTVGFSRPTRVPPNFYCSLTVLPLSFFAEPAHAIERSRRIIELARAWGSHYPVTHAVGHSLADLNIANYNKRTEALRFGQPTGPHEWVPAIHWLDILGKDTVNAIGRERVLSTPAYLVEELPTGAVLLVTRPTVADLTSEEARQAQARALVHLRPDLDLDAVLRELREHSAALAPVEPRFDPDVADVWLRALDDFHIHERQRRIAEWNQRPVPPADEWVPANALPADSPKPQAALRLFSELAEDLIVILHSQVPSIFDKTARSLADVDVHLWHDRFPEFYERDKIETLALPAVAGYLGEVLVKELGGTWVPRRKLMESQVLVGDRAWLPFVRARRYLQSRQSVLDFSLTKLYREAERHARLRRDA